MTDTRDDIQDLKNVIDSLKAENLALTTKQLETDITVEKLKQDLDTTQESLLKVLRDLNSHDERHATLLSELNSFKEFIMNTQGFTQEVTAEPQMITLDSSNEMTPTSSTAAMRSIPAPSKVMVDDNKKKDNRLIELRRITRENMNVDDEEAGLRLYKLQKTMIHVVSDLKKYMKTKNEDISKSWKSIDINTQRVAFEMVEREATSLGVPLNMCIGYWGARRLVSKSWANALRTTKKNMKTGIIIVRYY